jgi:hypothetical protein
MRSAFHPDQTMPYPDQIFEAQTHPVTFGVTLINIINSFVRQPKQ